jgi:hypothetical protein
MGLGSCWARSHRLEKRMRAGDKDGGEKKELAEERQQPQDAECTVECGGVEKERRWPASEIALLARRALR